MSALRQRLPKRPKQIPTRVKHEVAERSGGICEVQFSNRCSGKATEFHHVQKRSALGGHTAENLLHSCWSCNQEVEAQPLRAVELGVSRPRWGPEGAWL